MSLRKAEVDLRRLQSVMREMDELDKAAGEYQPRLSISEWIAKRMKDAVSRALIGKD